MAGWTPCERRDFIRKLRALGFSRPEPGGRHFYMRYGEHTIPSPIIPNSLFPSLRCCSGRSRRSWGGRSPWT